MRYVIEYELCALLFLGVVTVHFFTKKRFPSLQNRFFSSFIFVGISDIIFDVASACCIMAADRVPLWLNMFCGMVYYLLQTMIPAMLFLYLLSMVGYLTETRTKIVSVSTLPFLVIFCTVLTNPVTKWFFYFKDGAYYRGMWFPVLFIVAGLYFAMSAAVLVFNRAALRPEQYNSMLIILALSLVAVIVQNLAPRLLLTGVAVALSITMMYLTLQNPDDMLDAMTGVFNRSSFLAYVRSLQERDAAFQVILLDVDEMRPINDVFGIHAGDKLLCEVVRSLHSCAKTGRIFRIIGDEFAVITENERECRRAVAAIERRFDETFAVGGLRVELSACVSYYLGQGRVEPDDLLPLAEHSLAQAKKLGRGTTLEIDEEMIAQMQRENLVETLVRRAILNRSFHIHLQPMFDVATGRFTEAEALARLDTEELGAIPPAEFIPIAERKGLIRRISEQVLEQVCRFIVDNKLAQCSSFSGIAVNLSVVECLDSTLPDRIKSMLDFYGVDPRYLILEITETGATLSEKLPEIMQRLSAMGVRFSLDDFGTGYANIDSVMRLPFSEIKLDRSMLVASDQNEKSLIILREMVRLSKAIGLRTVVEGAETAAHVDRIRGMGADIIQGFYFARPLALDEVLAFICVRQ